MWRVGQAAGSAGYPAYTNPVFDRDFPDPFVLPTEDGYYAYATNSGGRNIQVIYSPDLFTWERAGEDGNALPKLPAWAQSNASLTWAPSVLQRGDEYILYYVTRFKQAGRQCISYAVADSPGRSLCGPERQAVYLPAGRGRLDRPGTFCRRRWFALPHVEK